ncbi:hypothetical protein [Rhizobium oryzicola]|uniref:Uncharacterized protein n=1 Tax=Rhizobium oryzicola TaxID=1232668 RepID=A0ABT8SX15_9HYPH|nr:hypothetical protein [Rhizobium oryzicola]MDO1582202.1 hypothetical protein [Rhizobium oryzicola]
MNDDQNDLTMFIGLHKLAQQNGDGLVPELYALLTSRPDELADGDRILRFPIGRARMPHTPRPSELADEPGRIIPLRQIGLSR